MCRWWWCVGRAIFYPLLFCLEVLLLVWFKDILRILMQALSGKAVEDSRSDSDSEEEEEERKGEGKEAEGGKEVDGGGEVTTGVSSAVKRRSGRKV